MKLIIATPSPFARKARIALLEKGIAHECVIDNPWLAQTQLAATNPLGKVPALLLDDGRVVFDSKVIVEYLEALVATPALLPTDPFERVSHRQIEAVADGICDAVVLIVQERARDPALRSADWIERQRRKVALGVAELERLLGQGECFTAHGFGLAEIATVCALAYLDLRLPEFDWRTVAPGLLPLFERLSARSSFAATVPIAQPLPAVR